MNQWQVTLKDVGHITKMHITQRSMQRNERNTDVKTLSKIQTGKYSWFRVRDQRAILAPLTAMGVTISP